MGSTWIIFFGLTVLLERFPNAKAIATPNSVEVIAHTDPALMHFFEGFFPGQSPARISVPEPYYDDTFTLERHELHIIEQGRTEVPHSTSLHVPSINLVVGGDVLYNECHMYVGDTTAESRENWIAALDRLAVLSPKLAVAGHKKPGPQTRQRRLSSRRGTCRISGASRHLPCRMRNCSTRWESSTRTGSVTSLG